jgi:hypothetical protein
MASCLFKHPPSTAQPPSPSRPISAPAPAPPRSLTARLTARARNPALPAQPQPIPASHAPLAQAQENGISPIRTPAPACPATLATPPDLRSSPSTASIPHRTADGPIPKTRSAHSTTAHPSLPRTGLRRRRKRASHLFKHPPPPAQPPSPPRPISAPAPAPPRSLTARLTARSRNPACLPDHSPSPASAAAWSLCAHRHMYVTGDRGGVRSPPLTSLI